MGNKNGKDKKMTKKHQPKTKTKNVKILVDLMDDTSRFWDNLAVKNKDIQKILDNYVYPLGVNFGWDFAWGNDGLPEVKFYKNGEEQKYVSADYVIKELKKLCLNMKLLLKIRKIA